MTQRRNSILIILRKSGLCHWALRPNDTCFTSHWLQLGCWVELSLCVSWKAHIFLNILISNTQFGKIWSYVFVSLTPRLDVYFTIVSLYNAGSGDQVHRGRAPSRGRWKLKPQDRMHQSGLVSWRSDPLRWIHRQSYSRLAGLHRKLIDGHSVVTNFLKIPPL